MLICTPRVELQIWRRGRGGWGGGCDSALSRWRSWTICRFERGAPGSSWISTYFRWHLRRLVSHRSAVEGWRGGLAGGGSAGGNVVRK